MSWFFFLPSNFQPCDPLIYIFLLHFLLFVSPDLSWFFSLWTQCILLSLFFFQNLQDFKGHFYKSLGKFESLPFQVTAEHPNTLQHRESKSNSSSQRKHCVIVFLACVRCHVTFRHSNKWQSQSQKPLNCVFSNNNVVENVHLCFYVSN